MGWCRYNSAILGFMYVCAIKKVETVGIMVKSQLGVFVYGNFLNVLATFSREFNYCEYCLSLFQGCLSVFKGVPRSYRHSQESRSVCRVSLCLRANSPLRVFMSLRARMPRTHCLWCPPDQEITCLLISSPPLHQTNNRGCSP